MIRQTLSALSLLVAAGPCLSQDGASDRVDPHKIENAFFRAFYEDRGEEKPELALRSYREFLAQAPQHRLAGHAARFAIQILNKLERQGEATKLAEKHASVLAETVPAGINANFLDPNADVTRLVGRFEAESREIFKHRERILEGLELQPGQAVADIGAGTGFFTNLFAREVGDNGRVYAVEISPVLVEHLRELAQTMRLDQVEVVECSARSSELPTDSVDVAFICDVYHHFQYPVETMQSIHRALRSGGQLIVIDFERIPGVTREWMLNHVRAGKAVFRDEIIAAGFELVREQESDFLEENYILRFVKKS